VTTNRHKRMARAVVMDWAHALMLRRLESYIERV
jgi:hypothetical protein